MSCFCCCFRVQRHKEISFSKDIFISSVHFFLTTRLLYVFTFSLGGSTEPPEPPLDPAQQNNAGAKLVPVIKITRHKFRSTYQIVVSKEFWRFFDAVRGFYINSAPSSAIALLLFVPIGLLLFYRFRVRALYP